MHCVITVLLVLLIIAFFTFILTFYIDKSAAKNSLIKPTFDGYDESHRSTENTKNNSNSSVDYIANDDSTPTVVRNRRNISPSTTINSDWNQNLNDKTKKSFRRKRSLSLDNDFISIDREENEKLTTLTKNTIPQTNKIVKNYSTYVLEKNLENNSEIIEKKINDDEATDHKEKKNFKLFNFLDKKNLF